MIPELHNEADRIWNATRPALRRHRLKRRALLAGSAAAALGGLAFVWSLQPEPPSPPRQHAQAPPAPPPAVAGSSSLAVLVVDPDGARFEELRPDQAADEGLQFELSLAPVITSAGTDWH